MARKLQVLSRSNPHGRAAKKVAEIAGLRCNCHTEGMSKLVLKYKYDSSFFDPEQTTDDFGRLSVEVETNRFAGNGGFWVQWQDVKEFGEALNVYPVVTEQPIIAQWGYEMQEGDDLILRVEIASANKRGDLVVRFEIADDFEPKNRVSGEFLTNYPDLHAFSSDITRLMNGEATEAILNGR